jgi:hypothetical protein
MEEEKEWSRRCLRPSFTPLHAVGAIPFFDMSLNADKNVHVGLSRIR